MNFDDGQFLEAQDAADQERRSRKMKRLIASLFSLGFGLVLVIFFEDWTIDLIPAPWLGYVLIAIGILALLGFNVFRGGPFDKRLDPPQTPPSDTI